MITRVLKFRYVLEKDNELKFFDISLADYEIESSIFERLHQLIVWKGYSIIDTLQYTGQRDISDKEIYEGDYLEGSESGEFGSILSTWVDVVIWNKEKAAFVCMDICEGETLLFDEVESDKIVGNIYTHPEWLQKVSKKVSVL